MSNSSSRKFSGMTTGEEEIETGEENAGELAEGGTLGNGGLVMVG